jgi:hypothetical protein
VDGEVFKGLCTCAWQNESFSSSRNPEGRQFTQHAFAAAGTNLLQRRGAVDR